MQTWFKGTQAPYQLDRVFADPATERTVTSWAVDEHPVADLGLSDHAPIGIDFDFAARS